MLNFPFSLYSNGYTPDIDQFRYRYSAGVSLHIPIYEGGRSDKKIIVAQSMLKQTQLGYETLSNRYLKDIRQSMNDVKSNQSSLLNAQTQVDEAKEAQKLAQSRYKNGTGTNLELTNAGTNVQRASLALLQYDFQLCLAKLELARLAGIVYW
ncbi:TolC family protein [Arcticibacter eurypsychrophilus]|uniref:TolC family protein n=1 Tax=Arcticibacter eurypsychrophilus TaxID=1434752 RepID=UPI00084D3F69|nr:TolC family protein [Arcticibacter eurypsychrophilus]